MTRTLLTAIFLTLFSQTAWAHKCVLSGNTAAEITAYNSCKNDLATGTAGHDDQKLQERIISLEKRKRTPRTQASYAQRTVAKLSQVN